MHTFDDELDELGFGSAIDSALTELNDAWNKLRNDAWGRGLAPKAPLALAEEINHAWERWRAWVKSVRSLVEFPIVYFELFKLKYKQLREKMERAGVTLTAPSPYAIKSPIQRADAAIKTAAEATAGAIQTTTKVLPWLVLIGAGFYLYSMRR